MTAAVAGELVSRQRDIQGDSVVDKDEDRLIGYKIGDKLYAPEDVTLIYKTQPYGVRHEIAWRIWCWEQGYNTEADRAIVHNWIRESDDLLNPMDRTTRQQLLEIADEVIRLARGKPES